MKERRGEIRRERREERRNEKKEKKRGEKKRKERRRAYLHVGKELPSVNTLKVGVVSVDIQSLRHDGVPRHLLQVKAAATDNVTSVEELRDR